MSTLKKYTDEYLKQYQASSDAEKKVINDTADANLKVIKDNYNAQVAETKQDYSDLYDQNEVQRIINERQIAESMANMGLTDSGLNRTQQTANQLSSANNKSKISVEQQRAIDTLARTMQASATEIENNRSSSLASIDSNYYNQAVSNATSRYNTELEAQQTAFSQQNEDYLNNKIKARTELISKLGDYELSEDTKQALVANFAYTYKGYLTDEDYLALAAFGLNSNRTRAKYDISDKQKYGYVYFDPNRDRVGALSNLLLSEAAFKKSWRNNSYSSYSDYLEKTIIAEWQAGRISNDDAKTLLASYGLLD